MTASAVDSLSYVACLMMPLFQWRPRSSPTLSTRPRCSLLSVISSRMKPDTRCGIYQTKVSMTPLHEPRILAWPLAAESFGRARLPMRYSVRCGYARGSEHVSKVSTMTEDAARISPAGSALGDTRHVSADSSRARIAQRGLT
jgi:hypothetical protein